MISCEPSDFTVLTMPARFQKMGDPHADMDKVAYSLDALLDLATRDESEGFGDAPWPPHFAKQAGEPKRVQPSKAKTDKGFDEQMKEGFGAHRFRKQSAKAKTKSTEGATSAESAPDSTESGNETAATNTEAKPKRGRTSKFPLPHHRALTRQRSRDGRPRTLEGKVSRSREALSY